MVLLAAHETHRHDCGDHEHQCREAGEQGGLGHVRGGLGADRGTAEGGGPESGTAREQHVAGAIGGDRPDQRGHSDHHQRAGGGLRRTLPECVDQHRDGEDRATAAERAQAEPDQGTGQDRDGDRGHASGPTRCRPTSVAFSKESSIATTLRPEASRMDAPTEAR